MAKKKGLLSGLSAAAHKAVEDTKGEINYGFQDLPPGIENGVAKLLSVKLEKIKEGKTNAGKILFNAQGVVLSPAKVDGIPCKGLRTSSLVTLAATGSKTEAENVVKMVNEVRKLTGDADLDLDDVEEAIDELNEEQPYFRFRTWKGEATEQFPNPRTNHDWKGVNGLEDYEPDDDDDELEDETAETEDDDEEDEPAPKKTPVKGKGKVAKPAPEPDPEEEQTAPFDDFGDLTDLAEKADTGKGKVAKGAQEELTTKAAELGVTEEEIDEANDWAAVAEMIKERLGSGGSSPAESEDDEEDDEDDWEPSKGEVYLYKPTLKNGKKAKKAVEVEVKKVVKKGQTVNVALLDDEEETFDGVPWGELSAE